MVDLPLLPDRIVTSTAPQSSVSRGDIQQNTNLMASAISQSADALMDIATRQAKDQAAEDLQKQKITREADGSVSVANPANSMIFGRAGEAYESIVRTGTIAQHSNIVSQELNDLHAKHQADPAGFAASATAWKESYLSQHGGGLTGAALSREFDQLQTQHFNAITNQAATADLNKQSSAISALQTSARDDVMAMVRGGASLEDPALQGKIQQYEAATNARAANPLLGYSKEQAALDIQTFQGEATANKLIYHVNEVYKDQGKGGGYTGALEAARDILTNPNYKLSEQQRDQYYHKATAEIRANGALRRQDITEARAAFNELSLASASGARIDSAQVETVASAFRAAGDPGGAARVYSSFIRKPLNDDFGKQPLGQQAAQLAALRGTNAAAAAQQFFVGKGYSPEQAAGIVGNLVHESGLDPGAVGDKGTSIGLAQFHNERAAALKKFAEARGKPANDFQTQLEFVDKELRGGKSGFITSNLGAADAAMKLTPQERALYERHVTNLTGPGGVDNPDGSRSTLYQATVDHDGKTYAIPTVWDGNILPVGEAVKRVEAEGWGKFPAYKSPVEAEARYKQMHAFMEKDTAEFMRPGTEAGTFRKLQGATSPEAAAHAFIDYERPQGWTPDNPTGGLGYESRKALARTVFDGRPPVTDKSMGPAGSLWLEANRARAVDDGATRQWATVMADYKAKGTRPALQTVNDVINAARLSRNADLLDTVAQDTARMDLVQTASTTPLASQQSDLTALNAAGASGNLPPGIAAVQADLQRRYDAISKGLQSNPIATTVQNFPDRFKPPGPLDFSSEGALAGSLAQRAAISQFAAQNWNTPPLPVLDEQDVQQVRAALQGPSGGAVLQTMATALKSDEMRKLLDDKGLRDSIVGLQSSPDPAKMSMANAVADRLWRDDPAAAEAALGPRSIDKLHAWQGMKDSFSTEEIAQNLNAPRDPAAVKVREEARKAALTETDKLTPADIAYKLGSGSWLGGGNVPFSASPQYGRTAGAAAQFRYLPDGMAAGVLKEDYKQTYAALRADGVESDKASELAVERLKSTWGPSEVGGGRLMKYPPEKYFPSILGSRDWMSEDLRGWVAKKAGPEFVDEAPGAKNQMRSLEAGVTFAGARQRNWEIAGLVSDSRTAAETSQGNSPSYMVAIRRSDGTLALLGAERGDSRITFEPDVSANYQRLAARMPTMKLLRDNPFSIVSP